MHAEIIIECILNNLERTFEIFLSFMQSLNKINFAWKNSVMLTFHSYKTNKLTILSKIKANIFSDVCY